MRLIPRNGDGSHFSFAVVEAKRKNISDFPLYMFDNQRKMFNFEACKPSFVSY